MLTQELIVAGFHRSGTSLLTQLLHRAGLFVGDDLIGAMPSNPFGHFEDRRIVRLHNGILRDNGLDWQVHDPFVPVISANRWGQMQALVTERRVAHPIWGFKDPRVCLFLPHWTHLMPDVKVVGVFRHPRDSIYSLERRHVRELVGVSGPADVHRRFFEIPDLALRMWLLHNKILTQYGEDHRDSTILLPFEALVRGAPVVRWLRSRWGVRLRDVDTRAVFDAAVTSTREQPQNVYDEALVEACLVLWKRLVDLSETSLAAGSATDETR